MRTHNTDSVEDPYAVAVLDKALDVLEQLSDGRVWTVAELSAATGITKTSVYRVVATLQRRGYLARDAGDSGYIAGPALLAVSQLYLANTRLTAVARPVLVRLHREIEETINLAVLDRHQLLYVDMIESSHGLRMAAAVGSHGPLYCTALGKAMLSMMEPQDAHRMLNASDRRQLTPKTVTRISDLMPQLEQTRARGFAIDDEETEVGARCVAVAIVDRDRKPIAGLSASGPAARLSDGQIGGIGRLLQGAGVEIEQGAGYRPVNPPDLAAAGSS